MKFTPINPPRRFEVGLHSEITISECAHIELDADELVTFKTESGTEYDIGRKSWGYYATPSMNQRLPNHGLRPALVYNPDGRYFVMLVEKGMEDDFFKYLDDEHQQLVTWLDSTEHLDAIRHSIANTK